MTTTWALDPDRCFSAEASQRHLARDLYLYIRDLALVCPHGHVPPALLANAEADLGSPAELFVIPDHYIFRMLYSQGVPLEDLGVPSQDSSSVETDQRAIWQRFAEHFYLFAGTPTGLWIKDELISVFGIEEKLNAENAQVIYDALADKLARPEFSPRSLFQRFNIEVLCTTDAAHDNLDEHRSLHREGWTQVRPTFRPDAVVNLDTEDWSRHIRRLSELSGIDVIDYKSFIVALEQRRQAFKELGATATDHAALRPLTVRLAANDVNTIFSRALQGKLDNDDAIRFTAHMLSEMARMSAEDGLVMQLHVGSYRNHNTQVFRRFGRDKGADMPIQTEWTRNLRPLLEAHGNDSTFRLILFTLDETTYSRELAPLAGHYPALRLGPPWWFFDSVKGMQRYLDGVVETAGVYNLAGFNDDTRAFASIPSRHDIWRRVVANWLAGECVQGLVDEGDAFIMAKYLAYDAAKDSYRL